MINNDILTRNVDKNNRKFQTFEEFYQSKKKLVVILIRLILRITS